MPISMVYQLDLELCWKYSACVMYWKHLLQYTKTENIKAPIFHLVYFILMKHTKIFYALLHIWLSPKWRIKSLIVEENQTMSLKLIERQPPMYSCGLLVNQFIYLAVQQLYICRIYILYSACALSNKLDDKRSISNFWIFNE